MKEPLIQDIPSIQKAVQQAKGVKAIQIAMPVLRPIYKLLGADLDQINGSMASVDEVIRQLEELATIPDRFNDLFVARGWIAYDLLNVEIAKAAIDKAASGDIDGAEVDLMNYYTAAMIHWKLQTMSGIKAFRSRMPLAQKASIDYRDERYHACVPVVLALTDGLVNELHEERRGFSADDVTLEAWDSVAGHSNGLNRLVRVMVQKTRQTTRTEQISIPYRNGIMHGMDLGYDNQLVAAKTWAALFAVRDWAYKAEQGQLTAPPEQPVLPWYKQLQRFSEQLRDIEDTKARNAAWQPRLIELGKDTPATGEPSVFVNGSPEQKLVEFLTYWKAGNYGRMAECLSFLEKKYNPNKLPLQVRTYYAGKNLQAFDLLEIEDTGAAANTSKVKIVYEEDGRDVERTVNFRLIHEDATGRLTPRGKSGGRWVLYTYFV